MTATWGRGPTWWRESGGHGEHERMSARRPRRPTVAPGRPAPPPVRRVARAPTRERLAGLLALVLASSAVGVVLLGYQGGASPTDAAATPAAARGSLTLAWVGDMAFDATRGLPPQGPAGALRPASGPLRDADLALGNLEGTLSRSGPSKCRVPRRSCFAFRAPPAYAEALAATGFDAVNLANNHAHDYGAVGLAQTVAALRGAGVGDVGRAGMVTRLRVRGHHVALVGLAPYRWASPLLDLPAAGRLIARARRQAPIVVVLMHAGAEGADRLHTPRGAERSYGEDRGRTRAVAHNAIRAGADLVLGSGPHVVRGVERYRGRLIAYSLGNFAGYRTFSTQGVLAQSGILTVRLGGDGTPRRAAWWSTLLDARGLPRPDATGRSGHLVRTLSRQDFGASAFPLRLARARQGK